MADLFDQYGGYIVPLLALLVGVTALIVGRYTDFWSSRVVSNGGRIFCVVCLLMAMPLAIIIEKVLLVDMQPSGNKYLRQFVLTGTRENELAKQEKELRSQLLTPVITRRYDGVLLVSLLRSLAIQGDATRTHPS